MTEARNSADRKRTTEQNHHAATYCRMSKNLLGAMLSKNTANILHWLFSDQPLYPTNGNAMWSTDQIVSARSRCTRKMAYSYYMFTLVYCRHKFIQTHKPFGLVYLLVSRVPKFKTHTSNFVIRLKKKKLPPHACLIKPDYFNSDFFCRWRRPLRSRGS